MVSGLDLESFSAGSAMRLGVTYRVSNGKRHEDQWKQTHWWYDERVLAQ